MKKLLSILMAGTVLFGCVACGGGEDETDSSTITIYAGGSSEFVWTEGDNEEDVIKYIENKYLEDTGNAIKFETNLTLGKEMKGTIATDIKEGKVDLIISHTSGGDGIDDHSIEGDYYRDLSNLIYDLQEDGKFAWTDGADLSVDGVTRLTNTDGKVIGIPSVINPYKFGILVRKDWMNAVGYTDDKNDTTKTYVGDFKTFTEMAVKMKQYKNLQHVITGAFFDVEKAGVLGACGVNAGYYTNTVYTEGETTYVGPGYINPNYMKVLEIENEWSAKGLLALDADTVLLPEGEGNFVAGRTGIFVQDPTVTHLIEVARKTKIADPSAEFTVLGALTYDKDSTEKGFMRNSVATFAGVIPKTSTKAKEIMAFLKWMYKNEDNYLLCKYGREGVEWTYDRDNGTYEYLVGSYVKPPYSGILSFVDNQNMADLQYAGYTAEERAWIETARNSENYVKNDTIDYLLHTSNADNKNLKGNGAVNISKTIRPIWTNGTLPVEGVSKQEAFESARNAYITATKPYLLDMNNIYQTLKDLAQEQE